MSAHNDEAPRPQAAAAVVTNGRGDVLLQLRDDLEHIPHPAHWTIPGGAIEPGEDPATAVLRELAEETGIRLARANYLFDVTDDLSVGGSGHLISVFHGTPPASAVLVLGEGQELCYFALDGLPGPMPPFAREAIERWQERAA